MTETKLNGLTIHNIDSKETYDALVAAGEIGENDLALVKEDASAFNLGITSAAVGDIIKVKQVDADGKPTAWEAAKLKYRQIIDFTVTETADTFTFTNSGLGFDMSDLSEMMFIIERPDDGELGAFIDFGIDMDGFTFSNEGGIRVAQIIYKLTSPMECESIMYKNGGYWWLTNSSSRHVWHSKVTMPDRINYLSVPQWGKFPVGTTIKCFVR